MTINSEDLAFTRQIIASSKWRVDLIISLLGKMKEGLTPEETMGAKQLLIPHVYVALERLKVDLFELDEIIQVDGVDYMQVEREWADCRRIAHWMVGVMGRAWTVAKANDEGEFLRDKLAIVAAAIEMLEAGIGEIQFTISRVFLEQVAQLAPASTTPDPVQVPDVVVGMAEVPGGVNPIVWCLDQAKEKFNFAVALPDEIVVNIPEGSYQGILLGKGGWAPVPSYVPWWGKSKITIVGAGMGRTTLVPSGGAGWGETLSIQPSEHWEGRVEFRDMTIQCSGANGVNAGLYGNPSVKAPLEHIEFVMCRFEDHPDKTIKCVRPTSFNQCRFSFVGCEFDVPNSKEHDVYGRNCFGVCLMDDCWSIACGGNVIQMVNRPLEGPDYNERHREVLLRGCLFEDFHRWPDRAGSAVTLAGSGFHLTMEHTVIKDVNRALVDSPPPDGLSSHGAIVVWDSGRSYPNSMGYSNGNLLMHNCTIVMKDSDRNILSLDALDKVFVENCGIYSSNGKNIRVGGNGEMVPQPRSVRFEMCNRTLTERQVALAQVNGEESLLKSPTVSVGQSRISLGSIEDFPQPPAED